MEPGRDLEITIEKLVPGGDGMARHDGKVVFVPMALPGEKARVRMVESKKDFARATVLEILEPSPDRVEPGCEVFGRCGGCDWQHMDYPAQLRHKVALVQDALRRTGGIEFPGLAIEPGKPWRYRNRVQIHRGPGGEGGFLARTSHAIVPVSTCPVSHQAFDLLFPPPPSGPASNRAERPERESRRHSAWTHAIADGKDGGPGQFLISQEPGATGPGLILEPNPSEASPQAYDRSTSRPIPEYLGPRVDGTQGVITATVLGKPIRFDLRCFFQSNLEMTEKLIPWALDGLAGRLALDLYCGVGLFGAFLKDRFERVLAVEENPIALEYALGNIGDTGEFMRGRVEELLKEERGPLASGRPDAVVVDPPRDGLDAAVKEYLIAKGPARLVYVSCNPVTLARDLKSLLAGGFRLDDLRLFDFYPQTAHVESVAKLSR